MSKAKINKLLYSLSKGNLNKNDAGDAVVKRCSRLHEDLKALH